MSISITLNIMLNFLMIKKPVLTVKTYKSNIYANEVTITGESKIIYSPDKPLSCGAKVWIETNCEVLVN